MPLTLDVDRLEYAVLVERAGLTRVPVVAAYSNYGSTVDDVEAEFDAAEQRCRQRGMFDTSGRVVDAVSDLVGVYAHTGIEYDLRFSAEQGSELRAAVSGSGRAAVRTVLAGDRVHLEEVRPSESVVALVSVLPECAPARLRGCAH